MRRGREDEKVMGPLFPRLHVNDADKGGPRAPPRNKMALCEQLSISSQRFNSGTAPSVPLPPHHAGRLVPSASSSQGHGHERGMFSPFYVPSYVATHATEKVRNHSTEVSSPHVMRLGLEKRSQRHVFQRIIKTVGNEQAGVEYRSLRPHGSSSTKESSGNLEGEDDFRVPTFVQPGTAQHPGKDHHLTNREMRTCFHSDGLQKSGKGTLKSPVQLQSPDGKSLEQRNTNVLLSRQHERASGEVKAKQVTMHIKSADNMSHSAGKEKASKPSNVSKSPSNKKCQCGKLNELEPSHCGTTSVHWEHSCPLRGPRHINDTEVMGKQDMTNARSGSYSQMPFGNGPRVSCVAENGNTSCEDNVSAIGANVDRNGSSRGVDKGALWGDTGEDCPLEEGERNDDASETSMVDSISGVGISPDDVVGVIGPKHFWKARRAMVNQQRVFALQIFELHRLIKVQKLIAASPHLLFEEDSCLRESPPRSPVKDPAVNSFVEPQQHTDKGQDESCTVNRNNESPEEDVAGIPSLHHEDSNGTGPIDQLQRNGFRFGNLFSVPTPPDKDPGSWSFPLPGSQWLIPVMSPTEGLIYKPYTGPCPPNGAFMAPVYGGCGVVPSGAGDFISPAYGIPTSDKQQNMCVLPGAPAVAPNFFPAPFPIPVANPLASSSAVEQGSPLAGPWPSGQEEQQSRNSCNMSKPRSEALLKCARKVHTAKDSDLQGSTASSPGERAQQGKNVGSLFVTTSCSGQPPQSHCRDHQPHVIKVVPHNPRTATESAARIFRSIQKERQQYDSV